MDTDGVVWVKEGHQFPTAGAERGKVEMRRRGGSTGNRKYPDDHVYVWIS